MASSKRLKLQPEPNLYTLWCMHEPFELGQESMHMIDCTNDCRLRIYKVPVPRSKERIRFMELGEKELGGGGGGGAGPESKLEQIVEKLIPTKPPSSVKEESVEFFTNKLYQIEWDKIMSYYHPGKGISIQKVILTPLEKKTLSVKIIFSRENK